MARGSWNTDRLLPAAERHALPSHDHARADARMARDARRIHWIGCAACCDRARSAAGLRSDSGAAQAVAMQRADFLNAVFAIATTVSLDAPPSTKWKTVDGVKVPDTALAQGATAIASAAEPVAIFNHSLRTYLFAEIIAAAKNLSHDAELVYVASILHDTGLCAQYMSDSDPFEVDGANVAAQFLAKSNTSADRVATVWDAIALHDNSGIASHKQAEVRLVNAGVGADFGGFGELIGHDQL